MLNDGQHSANPQTTAEQTTGLPRRAFVTRAFRLAGGAIVVASAALTAATLAGARAARRVLRLTAEEFDAGPEGPRIVQGEVVVGTGLEDTALLARCTHLGCRLGVSEGGDRLECACHGSRFSADGQVLRGPAARPLRRLKVRRDGDHVFIALPVAGESAVAPRSEDVG